MARRELILQQEWVELQLTPDLIVGKAQRFLPIVLLATFAAFLLGYLVGPGFSNVQRYRLDYDVTVDVPDMPIIEPLILKNVTQQTAKKINDSIPLTENPVASARPFVAYGAPESQARAIDCLAATLYYEAGNEALAGQMAVAQVVLNRTRHPAYPKSVCGVVFQGHERRTGCQFSYTCDGSMVRRRPSDAAWQQLRNLSRAMLNGVIYAPVGLATHYHTDWVLPVWSARLDKVRVERTHLFLRYLGYWGSPKVFAGRYTGSEAQYSKLAHLSPVHRSAETDALIVVDEKADLAPDLAAQAPGSITSFTPERVSESAVTQDKGKDVFLLYVDPLLESDALSRMAETTCGSRRKCKILAWADEALMPKGMMVDDRARSALAYSYVRAGGGNGRSVWNCNLFPREKSSECLPTRAGRG